MRHPRIDRHQRPHSDLDALRVPVRRRVRIVEDHVLRDRFVLGSRRADRDQRCGQSCQSQELLAQDAGRNVVLPNRSSSGPKGRGDFLQKYSRAETSDHARVADLAAVGVEEHDLSHLVPLSVFVALITLAAST
jgi:hypothetical protein